MSSRRKTRSRCYEVSALFPDLATGTTLCVRSGFTLARKIAATALRMWKDEEVYCSERGHPATTRALDS